MLKLLHTAHNGERERDGANKSFAFHLVSIGSYINVQYACMHVCK